MLRIAIDIYGDVSRIGAAVEKESDEVVGKVRILSVSRVQSRVYDDFLGDFHETHPRVELEIDVMRSADIISSLLQKTATAGVGLCRIPQPRLEQRLLLNQRYAFFCGVRHRLFGRSDLTLESLRGENFVSFVSDQLGVTFRRLQCSAINMVSPDASLLPLLASRKSRGWCAPATGLAVCLSTFSMRIWRKVCYGVCRPMKESSMWTCTCSGTASKK